MKHTISSYITIKINFTRNHLSFQVIGLENMHGVSRRKMENKLLMTLQRRWPCGLPVTVLVRLASRAYQLTMKRILTCLTGFQIIFTILWKYIVSKFIIHYCFFIYIKYCASEVHQFSITLLLVWTTSNTYKKEWLQNFY